MEEERTDLSLKPPQIGSHQGQSTPKSLRSQAYTRNIGAAHAKTHPYWQYCFQMRLSKLACLLASVVFLSITFATAAFAADIKTGDLCSPVGAKFKQKNTNFVCTKKGSTSVWIVQKKSASPTPTITYFTMPNLKGMNLQLAQDLLQSKGSYFVDQEDALDLGRFQLIDSNWKVCRQSPKSGSKTATSAIVTLYSVKLSERCP